MSYFTRKIELDELQIQYLRMMMRPSPGSIQIEPLRPDLGEYGAGKTIKASNTIHQNFKYNSVPGAVQSFSHIPGYPIEAKTAVIGEWAATVIVTATAVFLYIPTGSAQWNRAVADVEFTNDFQWNNRVTHASVSFFNNVAYIVTDSNPMLRLDLNGLIDSNAENFVPAVTMVEGAPRAHTSATVGQFLVLGATKDPMTEYDFNTPRVQWSAIGDPTDWRLRTEEGQETGNLPGAQTFSNLHGVISIAASERNMIVFGSNAIVLGTLIGRSFAFRFDTISPSIGIVGPYAQTTYGKDVFFLSQDGFKMLAGGGTVMHIGKNAIDETIRERINWTEAWNTHCVVNEQHSSIFWAIPVDGSSSNNMVVAFNYKDGVWSTLDLPVARSIFYGAPAIAPRGPDNHFDSVDDIPFSLNSPVWGGNGRTEWGFISSIPDPGTENYGFRALADSENQLPTTIEFPIVQLNGGDEAFLEKVQVVLDPGSDSASLKVDVSAGCEPSRLSRVPFVEKDCDWFRFDKSIKGIYHQITVTAERYSAIRQLNMRIKPCGPEHTNVI